MKGQVLQGFCGKRMPLCGRKSPDSIRRTELGRMGGRRNRHYMDTEPISITPPSTPEDVKNVLAQAMADVRAKKLEPRIATALTYMSRVLLDAFATTDLQKQLESLRQEVRTKRTSRDWQASRQATQLGHEPLAQLAQSASGRRSSVLSSRFISIKRRQWVLLCSD
jgi:hypothetical protein